MIMFTGRSIERDKPWPWPEDRNDCDYDTPQICVRKKTGVVCGSPGGLRAFEWKDGKLNSSTCIIIDWDTGSARDCAGARTDRPESLVDLLFSPQ